MFVEIDGKIFNLHAISAISYVNGGDFKMTRVYIIGGAFIDIKDKYRHVLLEALEERLGSIKVLGE